MIGGGFQGHVIGQMLDAEILELDFHRGADVDLHGEHPFIEKLRVWRELLDERVAGGGDFFYFCVE